MADPAAGMPAQRTESPRNAGQRGEEPEHPLPPLYLYERLLAAAPDHIAFVDRRYVYRMVSDSYCRTLARPKTEIEGHSVAEVFGPQAFASTIRPWLDRCLAGERVRYQAWIDFTANGRRYMDVSYVPFTDATGTIQGAVVNARDITELHRTELALAESEERARVILETAADAILAVNEAGRVAFANPAACQLTGYSAAQLRDRPITDLIPHAYRTRHETGFARYLRSGQPTMAWRNLAFAILHRDGSEIPVEVSFGVQRMGGHRLFIGVLRDVSERRRVERSLHEQRAHTQLLLDSMAEGMYGVDTLGNCTFVNPTALRLLGYERADELLGRHMHELTHHSHADGSPYPVDQCRAYSAFLHERNVHVDDEVFWRRDGTSFPVEYWSYPMRQEGRQVGAVVTFLDISERKHSEAQLEHMAHHDPLTDLPNRLLLSARLEHAIQRAQRDGTTIAVLFIDLDRFKTVNDSLGHPSGDLLLREVAHLLTSCVRRDDTVARLGGDEFVLVLEGLHGADLASGVARKVLATLQRPFELEGHALYIGASIGISLYPSDGGDPATLLKNADAAMYRSKEDGRNVFRYYSAELTRSARERLHLEAGLRQAIREQQFVLHYQPQIDVASGALVGAEALIRWRHAESGLISPLRFIPLAEETGLILPLGEWTLNAACEELKAWLEAGAPAAFTLAVNLSPRQFREPRLAHHIRAVLESADLAPSRLKLEITEGAIMEQGEAAVATLHTLKDLGVGLAIDDFGTGYSSLAYLRRFPIDTLKIDQSFMRDIPRDVHAMEIAATIIAMARNLHMQVLAEGVESEEQLAFLKRQGCDVYQGYLFSPPLPSSQFQRFFINTPA